MKTLTNVVMLLCIAISINVQAQQIIFEDFESGDPFTSTNVSTDYNVTNNNNCNDPNYRIGPNLNSVCNAFPNVPAIPAPGNCMSTNEDDSNPDDRTIYAQYSLNLDPVPHVVNFRTVQRHGSLYPPYFTENTDIDVVMLRIFPLNVVIETVELPLNSGEWEDQSVVLDPSTSTTVFGLSVSNPQENGDFAIDDIELCATNIQLT